MSSHLAGKYAIVPSIPSPRVCVAVDSDVKRAGRLPRWITLACMRNIVSSPLLDVKVIRVPVAGTQRGLASAYRGKNIATDVPKPKCSFASTT